MFHYSDKGKLSVTGVQGICFEQLAKKTCIGEDELKQILESVYYEQMKKRAKVRKKAK